MKTGQINWMRPAPAMGVLIAGGLVMQVYLAGLAVFGSPDGWAVHGMFGGSLAIPVIALACYGWFGADGKVYRRPASLLLLLYLLQLVLVGIGMETGMGWIAAFHPANALVMLITALDVVRRAPRAQSSRTVSPQAG
ncbi:DUF6220 domain-containing protein [Hoeflea sp. AS16]|uniref:DUF6220 domain-containing protein n=1 Tax=Hoeflea sp. AS16 TaxID=3135779 RepID=UPI00316BF379